MKTPQPTPPTDPMDDDCDDIFGPPRSYPVAYQARNRPSMISAKYKQKEERRKILKISMNKLKKIEDPEGNLCRSVLINNTMQKLQQETREEKWQKQQFNYPRCYGNNSYLSINPEILRNDKAIDEVVANLDKDVKIDAGFQKRLEEEIYSAALGDEYDSPPSARSPEETPNQSNKRSYEDTLDDCDVHDVLSQFYMPPTPRMLTGIDEDDDGNVVNDPLVKRLKLEEEQKKITSASLAEYTSNVTNFIYNNNNNNTCRFSGGARAMDSDSSTASSYSSCGQASMFGEIQTSVYHSLITSLET
ncbi:uncharacterized protein LOC126744433 isoform X2 [Anthonomus grandis grandis]|nr:uncharacterized protein LOC126744433 isoform X2 [Anthonomus grandis grandis]XP_050307803.1 uncharacterized protein LOC126744433 isoform X2 [Anthonomus grandis grandis]XP_050307804.1 uncharacterized protein LOC126744433 isoform X2 [Anthonomus grandis grandis]XP_050307805.1 uncharacterized protein LOC126744433 isoform X2 [Anthonomus grandis grandis]